MAAKRRAFSLIELLVVIAVIAILVALLMSAVQRARAAASRVKCQNNLKQVALALHLYHDTNSHFPQGVYNMMDDGGNVSPQNRRSWLHDTLPYIEQENLFGQFDAFMAAGGSALNFPENATIIPVLMCPSDPVSPKTHTFNGGGGTGGSQGFSGNYVVCAGSSYFTDATGNPTSSTNLNGIFFSQSRISIEDITDGTSNTAFVGEIILSPDVVDNDIRGRYYNPTHGGVHFSTRIPPNTMVPDQFDWCSSQPVPRAPCIWTNVEMFVSTRSYHVGGVNLALADGSVRHVANSVDPTVFQAIGSRNGGEPVGNF
jgi:prepilin-type N-terminal cleavage/methylation domain-containing protein/prepilin-type processing-associated H-X9-DG protein